MPRCSFWREAVQGYVQTQLVRKWAAPPQNDDPLRRHFPECAEARGTLCVAHGRPAAAPAPGLFASSPRSPPRAERAGQAPTDRLINNNRISGRAVSTKRARSVPVDTRRGLVRTVTADAARSDPPRQRRSTQSLAGTPRSGHLRSQAVDLRERCSRSRVLTDHRRLARLSRP